MDSLNSVNINSQKNIKHFSIINAGQVLILLILITIITIQTIDILFKIKSSDSSENININSKLNSDNTNYKSEINQNNNINSALNNNINSDSNLESSNNINNNFAEQSQLQIDAQSQVFSEILFILGESNGKLAVYSPDGQTLYQVFDVYINTLPDYDRNLLSSGIKINTAEQLASLLEDYSS